MKSAQILTLVLRIFLALLLSWAGYLKLSSAEVEIELFTTLGMEPIGRYLIGALEVAAAILILLPQSVVYGAVLSWGLMVGAVIAHLTKIGITGPSGILFGAAVLALISSTLIIYITRNRIEFLDHMFNSHKSNPQDQP